jgi:hypothetical protein
MNNSNLSFEQKVEQWNKFNNGIMDVYQYKSEQTKAATVKEVYMENVNNVLELAKNSFFREGKPLPISDANTREDMGSKPPWEE